MRAVLFIPFLLMVLGGCASTSARDQQLYDSLNSNIGVMTYDQAITTWGPPTAIADGADIFVATWRKQVTGGGSGAMLLGSFIVAQPVITHGSELQIIFNKATQKMHNWKYRQW